MTFGYSCYLYSIFDYSLYGTDDENSVIKLNPESGYLNDIFRFRNSGFLIVEEGSYFCVIDGSLGTFDFRMTVFCRSAVISGTMSV